MALEQYDIIQTDDNIAARRFAERSLHIMGLTYLGVPTLDDLEDALQRARARIYLVDGSFPKSPGGEEKYNADKAVEMIRKYEANALIVLVSGAFNIEDTASELGIKYISKGDTSAQNVIEQVKGMLEG